MAGIDEILLIHENKDKQLSKKNVELLKNKAIAFRQSEMRKHYEELFNTSVGELKFSNISNEYLLSVLQEIQTLTESEDPLIYKIVENAIERNNLDKLVHTRTLFGKKPR